jgi:pimeloyl-ACP methyl ester carboxylesterase
VLGDVDRISLIATARGIPNETPVLILAGGNDRRATPTEAIAIAERIGPNARVVIFDGAGHLELHRTDPNRYRELGLQFLAACPAVANPERSDSGLDDDP